MKYVTSMYVAATVLIMLGSLGPEATGATKSEAWNAGYHDAYDWIYGGHMKPQKSHIKHISMDLKRIASKTTTSTTTRI